jgi:signal transduction histidine kinase
MSGQIHHSHCKVIRDCRASLSGKIPIAFSQFTSYSMPTITFGQAIFSIYDFLISRFFISRFSMRDSVSSAQIQFGLPPHRPLPPIPTWGQPIVAEPLPPIVQVYQLLHQLPQVKLEKAMQQVGNLLQAIGVRLYLQVALEADAAPQVDIYQVGHHPACCQDQRPVEQHLLWQQFLYQDEHTQRDYSRCGDTELSSPNAWVLNHLSDDFRLRTLSLAFQATEIAHVLVIPLRQGSRCFGCISVFRSASAGAWDLSSVALLQGIAAEFAKIVQQHYMGEQINRLNQVLEQRSQELHRSLVYQKSLATVIEKVRATIDLKEVFHASVEELYRLLKLDRSVVYRFNPDWSGEFVAEAVGQQWRSLKVAQLDSDYENESGQNILTKPDLCAIDSFPESPIADIDPYLQQNEGGVYVNRDVIKQVDDIYAMNFPDCYLQILEAYQCRAYVIAPIYCNEKLWGLLGIYQNNQPRQWSTADVALVTQVASQLGIAIQQGELLSQNKAQVIQLKQALTATHNNQAQMIQTEKMVGLSQLVAGIAHEINNPVNFIHGNLNHLRNYYREILSLIELCQQYKEKLPPTIQAYADSIDVDFMASDIPKLINSMQMGTTRVAEIVLSLRNFSRLDEAEIKQVDIHEGLDSTLMILQSQLQGHEGLPNIEVVKHYGPLPEVTCYAGQLNQVFLSLLTNAIEAIHTYRQDLIQQKHKGALPGQIQIKTRTGRHQGQPSVIVQIKDDGPGIDGAIIKQIFDPFFTTKAVGKGTGLGLSISHQVITQSHGGVLRCHSNPGEGTEFYIEMPIAPAPASPELDPLAPLIDQRQARNFPAPNLRNTLATKPQSQSSWPFPASKH